MNFPVFFHRIFNNPPIHRVILIHHHLKFSSYVSAVLPPEALLLCEFRYVQVIAIALRELSSLVTLAFHFKTFILDVHSQRVGDRFQVINLLGFLILFIGNHFKGLSRFVHFDRPRTHWLLGQRKLEKKEKEGQEKEVSHY